MKKALSILISLMLIMSVMCITPVFATEAAFEATQTFDPVANAYYDTYTKENGYKTGTSLSVTQPRPATGAARTSFLKYDLTGIRENLAKGCEIKSATVTMTLRSSHASLPTKFALLKFDDDTWTEADAETVVKAEPLTADSIDALNALVVSDNLVDDTGYISMATGVAAADSEHPQYTLDITNHLISELEKADDNLLSFEVNHGGGSTKSNTATFFSRANNNPAYRPVLTVNYVEPPAKELLINDPVITAGSLESLATVQVNGADLSKTDDEYQLYGKFTSTDDAAMATTIKSAIADGETDFSIMLRQTGGTLSAGLAVYGAGNHKQTLTVSFNDGSEDVVINAKASNYGNSAEPDTAYKGRNRGYIRLNGDGSFRQVMLVKYDISSLADSVDAISEVKLTLPIYSGSTECEWTIGAYRISNSWEDEVTTWNTMPWSYYEGEGTIASGNVKVDASFTNNYDDAISFTGIVAVYAGDSLVGIKSASFADLGSRQSGSFTYYAYIPEAIAGETVTAKAMAFGDMTNLKPISVANEF